MSNDEALEHYWRRRARDWARRQDSATGYAGELKSEISDAAPDLGGTLYSDLMIAALSRVNWYEIAEHAIQDSENDWTDDEEMCEAETETSPAEEHRPVEPQKTKDDPSGIGEIFGDVIACYTRAMAIEDGQLVDVSEMAGQAGFRYPVALTKAAYGKYVRVPPGVEAQDESGRLWDVLYMCAVAVRSGSGKSEVTFSLHVRNTNRTGMPPLVSLKARCGPGDQAEPVVTIMLMDED